MRIAHLWIVAAGLLLGALAPVATAAEPDFVVHHRPAGEVSDKSAARFLASRPMPLPRVAIDPLRAVERTRRPAVPLVSTEPGAPKEKVGRSFEERLYDLRDKRFVADPSALSPKVVGTSGLHFTSTRLVPKSADKTYPYLAVGRLDFETPEGSAHCSAAVIAKRLVLTAGHCVHNGQGNDPDNFFSDFLFTPAFRSGSAPVGVWEWFSVTVSGGWVNSGGELPASDDYAILVMADRAGKKIGSVTGNFGTQTGKISPNDLTLIGYPANLDEGEIMHQVFAGQSEDFPKNTAIYGSDMGGGSSGGPWVQNFGVKATGQLGGNAGRNRIVSVTSYGPIDEDGPLFLGGSELDGTFTTMRTAACDAASGNC